MTTDIGTNMKKKVSMIETRRRLLVSRMVRKDSMKLMPMARKHPLAIRTSVMIM
jgi:hypothetical protein